MCRWLISAAISFFILIPIFSIYSETPNDHDRHYAQVHLALQGPPELRILQVSSGGSFKITVFADLHYGEAESTDWGPFQDVESDRVMSTILDKEIPDFVVYLGDVVTANNVATANASLYWEKAISPTKARGVPFATIFGNHDDAPFEWPIEWFSASGIPEIQCPSLQNFPVSEQCSFRGTQRLDLMTDEIKHNNLSYSSKGPQHLWPSVSNYVIQVSSSEDSKRAVAYLYFLDSGGGSYPQVISSAQASWFKYKSEEINPDSRVAELIFWHIPSKAYKKVAPKSGIPKPCVGSINEEKVASQKAEMGIMEALVNRSSVKAVFVGHNHGLDWCCPYKKLWLCYARHSGYGGYGDWPRGARIIEINEEPFSVRSWIRMEDDLKHSEVALA